MTPVFGAAALDYRAAGWAGVLPLPARRKKSPPKGFTGDDGLNPTDDQIQRWLATEPPDSNICLRVPDGVIGYDADLYKPEGRRTHERLVSLCGPLPPTWISTSRTDGSGIHFFGVPPGVKFHGAFGGVEIIQRHHRYAVVHPSFNPDSGGTYRWIGPDGRFSDRPPVPGELTPLPEAWLRELRLETDERPSENSSDRVTGDWAPCVRNRLAQAVAELDGSRHDTATPAAFAFVRYEQQGYPGAAEALDALGRAFCSAVVADHSRSPSEAEGEWSRMVEGARFKVASTDSTIPPWPETAEWEPPIPLSRSTERPDFPCGALPSWLADYVRAVAEATQTPVDLPAMLGLSVIAATLAGRVDVEVRRSWREPLNIYTVTALPTGERKSPVFRLMVAPLESLEHDLTKAWKPKAAEARARRQVLEDRAKTAKKRAAADGGGESEIAEAAKAEEELAACVVPPRPRLIGDDATQEALATLINEQGGRLGIFSAEGGIFEILSGRYTEGKPNIELFLKAYSGDSVRVDRTGRPAEHLRSPALTLGLTVQPAVIAGLAGVRGFRDRGVLARISYAFPVSRVGYRRSLTDEIDVHVERRYFERVKRLGGLTPVDDSDGVPTPRLLAMTLEARERLAAYQDETEAKLAPEGELQTMADWANRLPGTAVRLAGILHMADMADGDHLDTIGKIELATVERAIAICRDYLTAHALFAFELLGADPVLEGARRILGWVLDQKLKEFTERQAFLAHRSVFRRVKETGEALGLLTDHGFLARKPAAEQRRPGRPASPMFIVNPLAQKAQNAHKYDFEAPDTNSAHSANFALKASASTEVDLAATGPTIPNDAEVCARCNSGAALFHEYEIGRPLCQPCLQHVASEHEAARASEAGNG